MKSFLLVITLAIASVSLNGQSAKFEKAVEKGITLLESAEDQAALQNVSNHFSRIANAETDQWLAPYYQAYAEMLLAAQLMQAKDMKNCNAHINSAQSALDEAKKRNGAENAEILALQSFIFTGRIWEDPMTKGGEYSPYVFEALEKAIAMEPNNPRAHYLKGQMILFSPPFYGGGPANALPSLQKANELYATYESPSKIHPNWGKSQVASLLKQAQEQLESLKK